MLSESSYLTAIYSYIGAAVAILICLGWILGRKWRWPGGVVTLIVLLCAALLLTPAHPEAGVKTFAPALVVAVFEGLINGPEAAEHAFRPLLWMTGLALTSALILHLTLFRSPRRPG